MNGYSTFPSNKSLQSSSHKSKSPKLPKPHTSSNHNPNSTNHKDLITSITSKIKEEFNENTLVTAIKIQSSYSIDQIASKITLTVFTYDTEDDFENNEYRGNSKYSMDICLEGREC